MISGRDVEPSEFLIKENKVKSVPLLFCALEVYMYKYVCDLIVKLDEIQERFIKDRYSIFDEEGLKTLPLTEVIETSPYLVSVMIECHINQVHNAIGAWLDQPYNFLIDTWMIAVTDSELSLKTDLDKLIESMATKCETLFNNGVDIELWLERLNSGRAIDHPILRALDLLPEQWVSSYTELAPAYRSIGKEISQHSNKIKEDFGIILNHQSASLNIFVLELTVLLMKRGGYPLEDMSKTLDNLKFLLSVNFDIARGCIEESIRDKDGVKINIDAFEEALTIAQVRILDRLISDIIMCFVDVVESDKSNKRDGLLEIFSSYFLIECPEICTNNFFVYPFFGPRERTSIDEGFDCNSGDFVYVLKQVGITGKQSLIFFTLNLLILRTSILRGRKNMSVVSGYEKKVSEGPEALIIFLEKL